MKFETTARSAVTRFPGPRSNGPAARVPQVTPADIAAGLVNARELRAWAFREFSLDVASFARNLFQAVLVKVRQARAYRATVRDLGALDDRQLRDIGVSRGDIHYIARTVAYGEPRTEPVKPVAAEPAQVEQPVDYARAA